MRFCPVFSTVCLHSSSLDTVLSGFPTRSVRVEGDGYPVCGLLHGEQIAASLWRKQQQLLRVALKLPLLDRGLRSALSMCE